MCPPGSQSEAFQYQTDRWAFVHRAPCHHNAHLRLVRVTYKVGVYGSLLYPSRKQYIPGAVLDPWVFPCPIRVVLAALRAQTAIAPRAALRPNSSRHTGGDAMDVQFARDPAPAQSEYFSRRATLVGGVAAVLAAALPMRGPAAAQDASPEAAELVVEALGAGMPAGTPGRQLILARANFPAGFTLPAHTHPGPVVAFVESGTYGFTPVIGKASHVTRATAPGTPEVPTLGTEILLAPGDALFHDEDVTGIDRAVGDEPMVLLLAVLFDPTQPLYHLAHVDGGTPSP
jgi:hypothetical protein